MNRLCNEPTRPSYRIAHPMTRALVGAIAALAAACAGFLVFGPLSDLSALQLAAGPHAESAGPDGRGIVFAHTGRSWGAAAEQRQKTAAASDRQARLALVAANRQ